MTLIVAINTIIRDKIFRIVLKLPLLEIFMASLNSVKTMKSA